jgi:hypothetical protein
LLPTAALYLACDVSQKQDTAMNRLLLNIETTGVIVGAAQSYQKLIQPTEGAHVGGVLFLSACDPVARACDSVLDPWLGP